MLPDLWRMADRRVRVRASAVTSTGPLGGDASSTGALVFGILHHHQSDAWFHRSRAFLDGERVVAQRLRTPAVVSRHMSLMAHPLWEMCLDGALVRRIDGAMFAGEIARA